CGSRRQAARTGPRSSLARLRVRGRPGRGRRAARGPCLDRRAGSRLPQRGSRWSAGGRPCGFPGSALAALGVADHAGAPALLAFGQLVALAGVGILAVAEFDADRRAFEAVALAEEVLEVAPVAIGDVLGA